MCKNIKLSVNIPLCLIYR